MGAPNQRGGYQTTAWRMALAIGFLLADGRAAIAEDVYQEAPITDADREHWAYQLLVKPRLPEVKQNELLRSPVDKFIVAPLEKKGIVPLGEASREVLIRRLSLDLTGLPPTVEEIDAFVKDTSPDAYERLLDRLLASPAHGERYGQYWLDLARFAETDGYEHDKVRTDAWKYRDWVIAALNHDLPYDRFVQLQLAGDELEPGNTDAQIATTFCLAGPDMPDTNAQEERRHFLLNEMASTVGSSLLGLQFGCAQCHDHKYDPISQADFYRLRAIFEPAVQVRKDVSVNVLKEKAGEVPASRLWLRGDYKRPGPELAAGFPRIANPMGEGIAAASGEASSSQRRSALAKWITRADNPLTARVMANRIWQQHFGRGISDSPSDFGLLGSSPTHGELLDWLACELVENGWSLKHLHRVIVASATYRQPGRATGDSAGWTRRLTFDPENELYSRFPRRRLEGEAIRDSLLSVAGLMNRQSGGPGVMPPLPQELVSTLLRNQWKPSANEADHYRRSIYIFARRNLRYPLFEAFDRPDANASCAARDVSTSASQSLLLINSEFLLVAARHLAGAVSTDTQAEHEQIALAFRRTLGRSPSAEEIAAAKDFLKQQRELLVGESRPAEKLALPLPARESVEPYAAAALVDLCLALLNSSEFLYVD